ncbi:MAG: hypothetical protein FWG69_04250 [Oscillospiraceae bacterium]|nr:hypothetical protein [Oscillospiraceae bacterium]
MRQSTNTKFANAPRYLSSSAINNSVRGAKVYFGTGLSTAKEESCGFGIEFLNTVLTSLVIMKELGADSVLHEIGTVGYHISENRRRQLITEQLDIIANMVKNLCLENVYNVETSHSYHDCDFFQCILRYVKEKMIPFYNLPNFQNYGDYTVIQIAQMKFLYETEKTKVKVGWVIGNHPVLEKVNICHASVLINQGHLNEYYFDSLYRYVFADDEYSFVYIPAGMDIINGRKYAPYTVTKSQHRPLLTQPIKEYLESVPDSYHKRKALRCYEKTIIGNWEYLFGEIEPFGCISAEELLVEKLQYIQDRVLGLN